MLNGSVNICPYAKAAFINTINQNMNRCTKGHKSLIERANLLNYNDREELPPSSNWILPIFDIVNTLLPRLLCLLTNHQNILQE